MWGGHRFQKTDEIHIGFEQACNPIACNDAKLGFSMNSEASAINNSYPVYFLLLHFYSPGAGE